MQQYHSRGGSAVAQLRRASVYLALAVLIALAVAAAAKVMQGQGPRLSRSPALALSAISGTSGDSIQAISGNR